MIEALILQCAVADAPPAIIREIIEVESVNNPNAINVNKLLNPDLPSTLDVTLLAAYVDKKIQAGFSVDVGYMQVNSANFETYDLDTVTAFDPCTNIAVGSEIFMKAYRPAVAFYGKTEKAKQTALSAYNTGTFHRGFNNGYVARYEDQPANTNAVAGETPAPAQGVGNPNASQMRVNVTFGPTHTVQEQNPDPQE